jgi:hypothetical protein
VQTSGRTEDEPPELRFILELAVAAAGIGGIGPMPPVPGDLRCGWLVEYAAKTRLLTILGWAFAARGLRGPRWLTETATAVYRDSRVQTVDMLREVESVSRALDEVGIQAIFRKGVHTCGMYAALGCRVFDDIDVYVSNEDLPHAIATLRRIGYEDMPWSRMQRAYLLMATNAGPGVFKRRSDGRVLHIDVARAFLPPTFQHVGPSDDALAFGSLLARSAPCPAMPSVRVLGTADALLDALVNAYVGLKTLHYVYDLRFQRVTLYTDVLALGRTMSDADWKLVERLVRSNALDDVAACVLGMTDELFGDAIPCRFIRPELVGAATRDQFDTYGELDGTPTRWSWSLHRRLVADGLPDNVPANPSPL